MLNVLKNILADEQNKKNIRNSILIFLICFILPLCFSAIFSILFDFEIKEIFVEIIKILILYIPILSLLYIIFRFIKSKNWKYTAIIILTPLVLHFYYVIDNFFIFSVYSVFGFINTLFFIWIPIAILIILLFIRKADFDIKYNCIGILLTMYLVAWLMYICTDFLFVFEKISFPFERYKLSKYEKVLSEIDNYKNINGYYPQKLSFEIPKEYKYYNYQCIDNGKNYILSLSNTDDINKYFFYATYLSPSFHYCSDENSEKCLNFRNNKSLDIRKIGKWYGIIYDKND